MKSIKHNQIRKVYSSPQLPLAVYREVAAHLRQIAGVEADLINKPIQRGGEPFNYYASQIKALWLTYSSENSLETAAQIQMVLDFYAQRYQAWQLLDQ